MSPISPTDFESLVQQKRPVVVAAILRFSKGYVRADDLPDLEQEVWARLWRAMQSPTAAYDPARAALTTYLYMVARSVCYNRFVCNAHAPTNLALRLLPGEDRQDRGPYEGPFAISADAIPSLRDDLPEQRLLVADVLARFKAVAAHAEDSAQLLRYFEACASAPRSTEQMVAKEMGTTVRVVRQIRARAREVLTALGVSA